MPVAHFLKTMPHEALRDLDIRRGKASMEWYQAMRARHGGEMTAQDVEGCDPAQTCQTRFREPYGNSDS